MVLVLAARRERARSALARARTRTERVGHCEGLHGPRWPCAGSRVVPWWCWCLVVSGELVAVVSDCWDREEVS